MNMINALCHDAYIVHHIIFSIILLTGWETAKYIVKQLKNK